MARHVAYLPYETCEAIQLLLEEADNLEITQEEAKDRFAQIVSPYLTTRFEEGDEVHIYRVPRRAYITVPRLQKEN